MIEALASRLQAEARRAERRLEGPAPWRVALPAAVFLAVATGLMLRGVEPFAGWFYIAAWYPTLLLVDSAGAARTGRYYLLSRPGFAISVLAWSAVLWFFFELINFRLANWYYVFLPQSRALRWTGTVVSFATVLPAIFLAERLLAARDTFERTVWRSFQVTERLLVGIFVAGIAFIALTLAWPRLFFPLVWGALTLLLEPWNYRRDPSRSIIGDLSNGRPARLLRLLAGGLAIGFVWELYNIESRSKWIYTVPGFENFKLFEMPLLGFFGFPVFALDCYVAYQSLVLARVAVPELRGLGLSHGLRTRRTLGAALAAASFSLLVLLGMDTFNTDSLKPRLEELWLASPEQRELLGATAHGDVFKLAAAHPLELAETVGVDLDQANQWIAAARLATLRGIGMENARLLWDQGIRSVRDLAAADPQRLSLKLREAVSRDAVSRSNAATPPKLRVWVRAAQKASENRDRYGLTRPRRDGKSEAQVAER